MKIFYLTAVLGAATVITGCTTSAQVREMVDASQRECFVKTGENEASIVALKSMTETEFKKKQATAAALLELQAQLDDIAGKIQEIHEYADASKVASVASTVKVAHLEEALGACQQNLADSLGGLKESDKLHEGVMVEHFQAIADSADAAIESLKANGWQSATNAPVNLGEPMQIFAPDTSELLNLVPLD